jgi:hypothetical protein
VGRGNKARSAKGVRHRSAIDGPAKRTGPPAHALFRGAATSPTGASADALRRRPSPALAAALRMAAARFREGTTRPTLH